MSHEHSPGREWNKRNTPSDEGKDALLLGQGVLRKEIVFEIGHVVEVHILDGGGTIGTIP
jgi:hypothetical protein